jgi:beta-lactamase regulating signal transducer with metallopeptidase domain
MTLALGWHLLESTVFALIVGLLALCLPRRGAAARHMMWLIAAAKFVLPAALFSLLGSSLAELLPSNHISASTPAALSRWIASQAISEHSKPTNSGAADPLILIWLLGCAVMFIMWLPKLWASLNPAESPEGPQQDSFVQLKQRIGLRREVKLRFSDSVGEPVLAGFRKPAVMIPTGLARSLSSAEFESVILHELAHAKRRDNWTAAFAHAVTCMFWFYPLLWWIEKRLHCERELACDEMVIRCGAAPEDYVAGILKVCRFHLSEGVAGISGVCGLNLKNRMEAIMSFSPDTPLLRAPRALLGSLVAAVAVVPLTIGLLTASNTRTAYARSLFANSEEVALGTFFNFARQLDAPARVIEATFGIKDLLLAAKLKNVGGRVITRYRIGWVVVYGSRKVEVISGAPMLVPAGIAPGAVAEVPPQGVSSRFVDQGAREIMFFVNEVQFATGEGWSANPNTLEKEAQAENDSRLRTDQLKAETPIVCAHASNEYPEGTVIQEGESPEQMCARVLNPFDPKNPDAPPTFHAQWIHTSKAIRERSATVIHLSAPPPVFCIPKPPTQEGLCACEDSGYFSHGALVNSAKGAFKLRCDHGSWVQTATPNVERK